MALIDFTELPAVVGLTGAETVPVVQGGVTKRTTTGAIGSATFALDQLSTTTGAMIYRSSAAWTALAPGTTGQFLRMGATVPEWVTDLAADISVGSTIVTSGTDTRVLYDNAGVLGEYAISGTGSVAMTTSPTFVTPTLGAATATSMTSGVVTITQGTITADAPQLNGTVTWNSGGTTFTAWKLNVTDTASAATSLFVDWQVGGSTRASLFKSGGLCGSSFNGAGGSFAQARFTANAEASSSVAANGAVTDGVGFTTRANSGYSWVSSTEAEAVGSIDTVIKRSSAGVILLGNALSSTDFGSLQFGGTTSSFPALKRNGTGLQVRLADDSGNATIEANQVTVNQNAVIGNAVVFATGVLIASGTGSPEGVVTALAGSLYLNTAGGADTTLYTKTSGSGDTGWVAVENV